MAAGVKARDVAGIVAGLVAVAVFGLMVCICVVNIALGCGEGGVCWIIGR